MNGEYKIGDVVLGSWTLVKLLGEGAYGKVWEAHREEYHNTYSAAIKIMITSNIMMILFPRFLFTNDPRS